MDAFPVTPLGPATLSAVSALRPARAVQIAATQNGNPPGSTTLNTQDLAQQLFLQALQAATLSPVADANLGVSGPALQATSSLLAALTAPQAAAAATPTPDPTTNRGAQALISLLTPLNLPQAAVSSTATPNSTTPPVALDTVSLLASLGAPQAAVATTPATDATTNPVAQAAATGTATTPTATPATPAVPDTPVTQDSFDLSSSADFALQTALRFGAGVSGLAAPAAPTSQPAELVRDAMAVVRTGNLQPQAGHPGPEAFTHPQVATQRVLRSYEAAPALQGTGSLDLMA